jgi:SAM-dependent methyltransferase
MKRQGEDFVSFRHPEETTSDILKKGLISDDEWEHQRSYERIFEESWKERYEWEKDLLVNIIKNNKCKRVIELGPGPGALCSRILKQEPTLDYHLVDIEAARIANKKENLGGNFHVQDLTNDLDTSSLPKDVDLFVANDFLEHIQSPANVVLKAKSILKEDGLAFISVPNWRMGHAWIYRGLFDWDNFIHFMWQHGFGFQGYFPSNLKCSSTQKISSESTMPDEMISSWNWYLLFKRNDNEK